MGEAETEEGPAVRRLWEASGPQCGPVHHSIGLGDWCTGVHAYEALAAGEVTPLLPDTGDHRAPFSCTAGEHT